MERCREHLQETPDECMCGIHALYGREIEKQYRSNIYASVVGWGAVAYREKGWRAEYVRMDRIWVNAICHVCHNTKNPNIGEWLVGKDLNYHSFLCKIHMTAFMLGNALRPVGIAVSEFIERLQEQYTESEVVIGYPWA